MNGFEKRTEQKRELILTIAQRMFFQYGIVNTSVEDLAGEAKVSKVTIFNYFGNKENLAREVIKRYINSVVLLGEKIINEPISFYEKMNKLFSIGESNRSLFDKDIFSKEAWEDPLLQQIYSDQSSKALPLIIHFFEQGKDEGIIDPSIPTEALLSYVSAITPLLNPGKSNINNNYILGMHKLFYFGLFGNNSAFVNNG